METASPATEETKTALENAVDYFLTAKLQGPATTIATIKFLTNENELVYLTRCNVAETAVPKIKVQILRRVDGGVKEVGYHLFADHRFERYENNMLFGRNAEQSPAPGVPTVSESEAHEVLTLISSLGDARQLL